MARTFSKYMKCLSGPVSTAHVHNQYVYIMHTNRMIQFNILYNIMIIGHMLLS